MIVVLAEIEIALENLAPMKEAVREMEKASLAEAGCHEYCFSQELSHPEKLRIVELWESMDALSAHFAMPHMAKFNQTIGAHPQSARQPGFGTWGFPPAPAPDPDSGDEA